MAKSVTSLIVMFGVFVFCSGCGGGSLRGMQQDQVVNTECMRAGLAPCNALVVAVREHRKGNREGGLTSLNVWLAEQGVARYQLAQMEPYLLPIARASADAGRLFADALQHPNLGESIPLRRLATGPVSPAAMPENAAATATQTGKSWMSVSEYEQARDSGLLRAVSQGEGFLLVTCPAPGARLVIGQRTYAAGSTVENVRSGYRQFRVEADGWSSKVGYVLVEPLKVARAEVFLDRGKGALTILSSPSNAEVIVDGLSKGRTPLTLEQLPSGQYQVELRLGNLTWRGRAMVSSGAEVLRTTLTAPAMMIAPAPVRAPVRPAARPVEPRNAPRMPVAVPVRAPKPAPVMAQRKAPTGGGVDLRSLGPDLEQMAWANLRGKNIVVTLGSGKRASVLVSGIEGTSVVLTPEDGTGRLVPMADITRVEE